jgi:hypothetical protein
MRDTHHTPGPWTWEETDYGSEIVGATGDLVVSLLDHQGLTYSAPEAYEANARLLAAAPALLAACRVAERIVRRLPEDTPHRQALLAVLAEALARVQRQEP